MHAHHTALGIASLGRHGDDMLVHMSREEVQGLQALAKTHGTSLTINPDTGMPEAFKLGGIFRALIPIAAGFMFPGFGAGFGGFLGEGIAAGALAGGITSALTGGNPLMGAITGGLGGYGGAGLAGSAANVAKANALKAGATTAEANLAATTAGGYTTPLMEETARQTLAGPVLPSSSMANTGLTQAGTFSPALSQSAGNVAGNTVGSSLYTPTENFKTLISNPVQVAKNYGLGKTAIMGAGVLNEAGAFDMNPIQNPKAQEYMKKVPTGQYDAQGNMIYESIPQSAYSKNETLNLNTPYANYPNVNPGPGLQLPPTMIAKEGGEVHSYAIGGPVTTTGVQSLYSSPDGTAAQNTPMDAYGIGRLNSLANAEAMNTAKTFGYATGGLTALSHGGTPQAGGYLDGQGDGMSDSIPATIEGKQPARLADGEFVVPADVVSHIGNGSSKAGSKRLYAMLDKVRKARTGHTKQGKQINPNQYLPA